MAGATAVVAQRIFDGEACWGFDAPEGFAPYGSDPSMEEFAGQGAAQYNGGDHCWSFVALHVAPRILRLKGGA